MLGSAVEMGRAGGREVAGGPVCVGACVGLQPTPQAWLWDLCGAATGSLAWGPCGASQGRASADSSLRGRVEVGRGSLSPPGRPSPRVLQALSHSSWASVVRVCKT